MLGYSAQAKVSQSLKYHVTRQRPYNPHTHLAFKEHFLVKFFHPFHVETKNPVTIDIRILDILDTSGLRVYYENPRKYEAAMITTGITMNDNMIIPPGMKQWTVQGVCTKACTEVSFINERLIKFV